MLHLIPLWLAFALTVYAAAVDIRTREVPDWITIVLLVIGLVSCFLGWYFLGWHPNKFLYMLAGAAVPAILGGLMMWQNPEVLGGGDWKLLIGLGAIVGFPSIMFLFVVMIFAGGAMGLVVMALHHLRGTKRDFPYVPAITTATFVFAAIQSWVALQSSR